MKSKSLLAAVVILCALPLSAQADLHEYRLGDNDGFGTGSPLGPGGDLYINTSWEEYALLADGDGTDELIPGARDPRDFVFSCDSYSSTTTASLFVQYMDWPESRAGFLWIDDHKTAFQFPYVPYDGTSPWKVLGATIDLMPYAGYLLDGRVVFNLLGENTDAYIVDYMRLSIDGCVVPIPSAVLLGFLGLGYSSWRLRRTRV